MNDELSYAAIPAEDDADELLSNTYGLAELPFDVLVMKTKMRFHETKKLGETLGNVSANYQTTEDLIITNISPKGEGD